MIGKIRGRLKLQSLLSTDSEARTATYPTAAAPLLAPRRIRPVTPPERNCAVLGGVSDMILDDFGGLHRDLAALIDRRRALRWMGGLTMAGVLAACSDGESTGTGEASTTSEATADQAYFDTAADTAHDTAAVEVGAGDEIPDETAGPFPADGSNGPNLLAEEGVVRSDITTSIGSLSGTAEGVPTTMTLTLVDAATGSPLAGAAVYLWHCTAAGRYSIYEIEDQNFLRGVQVADNAGRLTFETVFPGCYRGRWPHCHFEVFESIDVASAAGAAVKTSQLALPQADCEVVYGDSRYGDSLSNLGRLSLTTDNVFADGWEDQLATVAGSNDDGYQVTLLVRV